MVSPLLYPVYCLLLMSSKSRALQYQWLKFSLVFSHSNFTVPCLGYYSLTFVPLQCRNQNHLAHLQTIEHLPFKSVYQLLSSCHTISYFSCHPLWFLLLFVFPQVSQHLTNSSVLQLCLIMTSCFPIQTSNTSPNLLKNAT